MRNIKRTTTAVVVASGLAVGAVSPAFAAGDHSSSERPQRNQVVRDIQDNANGNDLGGNEFFDLAKLPGVDGNDTVLDALRTGDVTGSGDNPVGNQSGNGTLSNNDVGGVGNGNHAETGDTDVTVDPDVDAGNNNNVDPNVDGGGDTDGVDDDSTSNQEPDNDVNRDRQHGDNQDSSRSEESQDGLLGGLL